MPASIFQYTSRKEKGLGWKSTTYDRSSLYLTDTFQPDLCEKSQNLLNSTVCIKVAQTNHAVTSHGRDTGHYADFVVARYFSQGECKDNRIPIKYDSRETIFIDNVFNGYQKQSLGSNVHSLTFKEGKDNSTDNSSKCLLKSK